LSATVEILVILVLLLANGVLAMSEIAVVSARKTRLKNLAERGNKRAKAAFRLANEPGVFLSTVQVGISLVGVVAGAFGGATIAVRLEPFLEPLPLVGPYAQGMSVSIVVLGITFLSLVLGELVPKQFALRNAESLAMMVARPMMYLSRVAYPLVALLTVSSNAILRLIVKGPAEESIITEDEVKLIIRQATEAGVVKKAEKDMIYGVLRLGDLQAVDLMTPRHEVVMLDLQGAWTEHLARISEAGHTYFPVYESDPTNVLGFVSVKDLYEDMARGREPDLRKSMMPPLFVPEKASALKVLERFKATKTHIGLVLDEHGAVEGLVSINDLLAGIVGEIPSTGEELEEPLVVKREDGSLLVDGGISASDLKELLKLKKLPGDDGSYSTLGGMTMARLGRIPRTGDTYRYRGYRFEVVDMDRLRVDKVLITKVPKEAGKTSASGSQESSSPHGSKDS
jgi:putative hemolysin